MAVFPRQNAQRSVALKALRITLFYALFASLWIFGSDLLLERMLSQASVNAITRLQTLKGLLFVFITAGLLFVLIYRAIAEQNRARQESVESESKFRRLIENLPSGLFIQLEGKFAYANPAMVRLLRCSSEAELIGRSVLDFFHPDDHDAIRERLRSLLVEQRDVPIREERMICCDQQAIWVEVAAITFEMDGKRGAQVLVRDITRRKLTEEALKHLNETLEKRVADRTAELNLANLDLQTFSYMISNGLRSPLRTLMGSAAELLHDPAAQGDSPLADHARRIVALAARLDRLVESLFEYNRVAREEAPPERISVVLVMHEVIGQLQRDTAYATAQVHVIEPLPWVLVHRPTLTLVVLNLLQNSMRHASVDGTAHITIHSEPKGELARIIFEDNGPGMEASLAADMFRNDVCSIPAMVKEGLGLTIIRRGVERMGGKIGVSSSPGKGSRFWIDLPRDPQSP